MRFASPSLFLLLVSSLVACGSSSDPAPAEQDDGAVSGDATETGSDGGVDAPPAGAGCTVAAKGTAGITIQGILLVPAGPTAGEVFIDGGGKIACAAASCASTAGYAQATHVKCPSSAIAPAFVNAHDHTDYDAHTPLVHGTTRWTLRHGWRTGANGETKAKGDTSPTTDQRAIAASELRFVMGGATSIVGSGGVSGLARNLAAFKNPEQLEGLTGDTTFFDTFPLGDTKGEIHDSGCAYPSIRAAGTAFSGGAYAPHIAEGIATFSHNEIRCLTTDPNNLVKEQTSIIHAVAIDANDVDLIAKAKAKVIWSPRSNIDLYGNTAPVTELARAGVTIALGTDWVPSGSINVLRELQCADALNQKYFGKVFDDKALFEMATKNAAIAAGFASQLGTLEVGKVGDVTVFENAAAGYRAVIDAGVEDVKLVLRGGKVLFGDAAVVSAIGAPCAALDVCGTAKQACIDTPSVTLADAQAAAGYPLFFCKGTTPTNEPSCTPYRDTYPMGTSATDRDGDGVADSADDCPDVFNPIRPMDGTKQSDVDGDGEGDACDVAPLDPAKH